LKLFLAFIFFSLSGVSRGGEGDDWVLFSPYMKQMTVVLYEKGHAVGTISAISMCTSKLFPDQKLQVSQFFKLSKGFSMSGRIKNYTECSRIVSFIDEGYSLPGSSDVNIATMIEEAISSYKGGKKKIPDEDVFRWIKASNYQPSYK